MFKLECTCAPTRPRQPGRSSIELAWRFSLHAHLNKLTFQNKYSPKQSKKKKKIATPSWNSFKFHVRQNSKMKNSPWELIQVERAPSSTNFNESESLRSQNHRLLQEETCNSLQSSRCFERKLTTVFTASVQQKRKMVYTTSFQRRRKWSARHHFRKKLNSEDNLVKSCLNKRV